MFDAVNPAALFGPLSILLAKWLAVYVAIRLGSWLVCMIPQMAKMRNKYYDYEDEREEQKRRERADRRLAKSFGAVLEGEDEERRRAYDKWKARAVAEEIRRRRNDDDRDGSNKRVSDAIDGLRARGGKSARVRDEGGE